MGFRSMGRSRGRLLGMTVGLIGLLSIVSGCASRPPLPEQLSASDLNASTGLLVGSFARVPLRPMYNGYGFYFENEDGSVKKRLYASPNEFIPSQPFKNDYQTPGSEGAVFAMTLPAGRYHFNTYDLFANGGYVQTTWHPKKEFDIPFEVKANTINYVGEIRSLIVMGRNLIGFKIPAGGVWIIEDQAPRDVAILKAKYPGMDWEAMRKVVPTTPDPAAPNIFVAGQPLPDAVQARIKTE